MTQFPCPHPQHNFSDPFFFLGIWSSCLPLPSTKETIGGKYPYWEESEALVILYVTEFLKLNIMKDILQNLILETEKGNDSNSWRN